MHCVHIIALHVFYYSISNNDTEIQKIEERCSWRSKPHEITIVGIISFYRKVTTLEKCEAIFLNPPNQFIVVK